MREVRFQASEKRAVKRHPGANPVNLAAQAEALGTEAGMTGEEFTQAARVIVGRE